MHHEKSLNFENPIFFSQTNNKTDEENKYANTNVGNHLSQSNISMGLRIINFNLIDTGENWFLNHLEMDSFYKGNTHSKRSQSIIFTHKRTCPCYGRFGLILVQLQLLINKTYDILLLCVRVYWYSIIA